MDARGREDWHYATRYRRRTAFNAPPPRRNPVFTGIIERTGRVERIGRPRAGSRSSARMTVDLGRSAAGLKKGQSVAVNGACLTVVARSGSLCDFEMIDETMERTALGALARGDPVNIERPLRAGARLDGHFVQGHVDGVGTITGMADEPGQVRVSIRVPRRLVRHIVEKGSIAVDGISLTVAGVRGDTAQVCLIPHTVGVTNFASRRPGGRVNIETDILAKYAVR